MIQDEGGTPSSRPSFELFLGLEGILPSLRTREAQLRATRRFMKLRFEAKSKHQPNSMNPCPR